MKNISILDQFKGFLNTADFSSIIPQADIQTFDFPNINISPELIIDLENLDHPRNSVLGKKMESFFEIAIKHSERYELIDANLQIIENKRTMGELDFLVYDKENSQPLHVELVYKLYIYIPASQNEKKNWIGPNRRDSFYLKLEKLKSKQFPLLYKPESGNYLTKTGFRPEEFEQRLCFKAQLFLPNEFKIDELTTIKADHISGKWYRYNKFLNKDWKENLFYSPKKKYWSCNPEENNNWMSHGELLCEIEELFENQKAPLIWMKTNETFQKFFIVWW